MFPDNSVSPVLINIEDHKYNTAGCSLIFARRVQSPSSRTKSSQILDRSATTLSIPRLSSSRERERERERESIRCGSSSATSFNGFPLLARSKSARRRARHVRFLRNRLGNFAFRKRPRPLALHHLPSESSGPAYARPLV